MATQTAFSYPVTLNVTIPDGHLDYRGIVEETINPSRNLSPSQLAAEYLVSIRTLLGGDEQSANYGWWLVGDLYAKLQSPGPLYSALGIRATRELGRLISECHTSVITANTIRQSYSLDDLDRFGEIWPHVLIKAADLPEDVRLPILEEFLKRKRNNSMKACEMRAELRKHLN